MTLKIRKRLKRSSIPKNIDLSDVTLEYATKLLSLPREVGHILKQAQLYLQTMEDMDLTYNTIKNFILYLKVKTL